MILITVARTFAWFEKLYQTQWIVFHQVYIVSLNLVHSCLIKLGSAQFFSATKYLRTTIPPRPLILTTMVRTLYSMHGQLLSTQLITKYTLSKLHLYLSFWSKLGNSKGNSRGVTHWSYGQEILLMALSFGYTIFKQFSRQHTSCTNNYITVF